MLVAFCDGTLHARGQGPLPQAGAAAGLAADLWQSPVQGRRHAEASIEGAGEGLAVFVTGLEREGQDPPPGGAEFDRRMLQSDSLQAGADGLAEHANVDALEPRHGKARPTRQGLDVRGIVPVGKQLGANRVHAVVIVGERDGLHGSDAARGQVTGGGGMAAMMGSGTCAATSLSGSEADPVETGCSQTGLPCRRRKRVSRRLSLEPAPPCRQFDSMMFRPGLALLFLSLAAACVAALPPASAYNTDEAKVGSLPLPDPLQFADGSRVRTAAQWMEKRRPELMELFAREMFGRTPLGRPPGMRWTVTSVDRAALGGKAVRKEVTLAFAEGPGSPQLHLLIYLPVPPVGVDRRSPAFLGLNFFGNQSVSADPGITVSKAWMRDNDEFKVVGNRATEGTRGVHASRWVIEQVVARGYATVTAYYGDLCEDRPEGLAAGVAGWAGTGSTEGRAPDAWGAIGVWAWGLSRAMDYLSSDPEIDASRVAVHGHSRLGKAALWAGAQDARFALVISNDSGAGGAALAKRNFGENVERLNLAFPHWFARAFRAYNGAEERLPFDSHTLIALMAPRPVYVASAVEDTWADPRGEFLATLHAEPVFALLGRGGLGRSSPPEVDRPVHGDALAYHVRSGKHDITPYDWAQYLDFADRVLAPSRRP